MMYCMNAARLDGIYHKNGLIMRQVVVDGQRIRAFREDGTIEDWIKTLTRITMTDRWNALYASGKMIKDVISGITGQNSLLFPEYKQGDTNK